MRAAARGILAGRQSIFHSLARLASDDHKSCFRSVLQRGHENLTAVQTISCRDTTPFLLWCDNGAATPRRCGVKSTPPSDARVKASTRLPDSWPFAVRSKHLRLNGTPIRTPFPIGI
jgi:hypothetical protein